MDPITLCAHRDLLIAVEIGSDPRFVGSTLNFHILVFVFFYSLFPVLHIQVWVGQLMSSFPGLPGPLYRFLW